MFSVPKRIKDALDRTLAEEQARHKAFNERQAASSNTHNTKTFSTQDIDKQPALAGLPSPHPTVFETIFKLEDDPPSRSSTPKHASSGTDAKGGTDQPDSGKNDSSDGHNASTDKAEGADTSEKPDGPALPPGVQSRLRKLEKLEATYPELLRSYRIAHSRIDPFERVLREHTPLSSIKDPAAFVGYLNQLNQKTGLMTEELKAISAEKALLKQKSEASKKELAALKDEISALKTAQAEKDATKPDDDKGDEGGDAPSKDDKIRELNAMVASQDERMTAQASVIDTLQGELATVAAHAKALEKLTEPSEPDTRDAEIKSLKDLLEQRSKELADSETESKKERFLQASTLEEQQSEIEKLHALNKEISVARDQARDQLSSAKVEHKKRLAELESRSKVNEPTTPMSKKNMRKKGKMVESPVPSLENPETEALKTEVSKLKGEIAEKDSQINKLTKQKKIEEDLHEEVETLKESVVAMGSDLVEKSNELKEYKMENDTLKFLVSKLETEIKFFNDAKLFTDEAKLLATQLEAQLNSTMIKHRAEIQELKAEKETLDSDLAASRKVSQDRFKELTASKELITKMQAELKSHRQNSETLKTTREELASKQNELRALAKREKELKNEVAHLKRQCSDYESEIKSLKNQVSTANTLNAKLEDEKRRLGRDSRRLEQEKADIRSGLEKTSHELEAARTELSSLRPKVEKLEDEVAQLQKEKNRAKEDVDFKTRQYESANKLVASMRDESLELATQLKEAKGQSESLEEERLELQRLLSERTREGETMRRMLADANEQADAKVRDMMSRMETAIEDRDQFEDKYSALARQRSREIEELKNKVHELESEVKHLSNDKHDLETREREFGQRWAELERREENALAEAQDLQSAVLNLRSALGASEQQARNMEKQLADSRKHLEEATSQYEQKVNKAVEEGIRAQLSGADVKYLRGFLLLLFEADEKTRLNMVSPLTRLVGFNEEEAAQAVKAFQKRK